MAFVCIASRGGPHPAPIEDEGGCVVVLPVGHDDEEGIDYTLMVGLAPAPGGIPEFFFCIIAANVNNGCKDTIWSGRYVSRMFTRYDRCLLRECLISVARSLVNFAHPARFSMTAYDDNLPERALVKFHCLNKMFERSGYTVRELDRWCGKHSWMAELG
jgi:hypothetical protein